jgi:hypothetical protein
MMNMNIDEIYGSGDYLKAADLKGKEHTLTIAAVETKAFNDGTKIIIRFEGAKKHLVVNKLNAKRIGFIAGKNAEHWPGKKITLFSELTDFRGEPVQAIRVKPADALTRATPFDDAVSL